MEEISLTGATMLSNGTDPLAPIPTDHHGKANGTVEMALAGQLGESHGGSHGACCKKHAAPAAIPNENNSNANKGEWLHPAVEMTAKPLSHSGANGACCNKHATPVIWQPALHLKISKEQLVRSPPSEILKVVWQLVRFGTFEQLDEIVKAWIERAVGEGNGEEDVYEDIRKSRDPAGHTLLHWATKRFDNVNFVRYFVEMVKCKNLPANDSTQMSALHWACTLQYDQVIDVLEILMKAFPEHLEIKDSTGCTPLLIAAQHGQVELVAYFVTKGASLQATDQSGDSAVHWAAYKGSDPVLGLLAHYEQARHWWTVPDVYGQMPLHLAALRGHVRTCRYILKQLSDPSRCLQHKDKNKRTPLELAKHKEQAAVVVFLNSVQSTPARQISLLRQQSLWWWIGKFQQMARTFMSKHSWQVWLGVAPSDQDEAPVFPYYYVSSHCILNPFFYFSVFLPLFNTEKGILWDCMGMHAINVFLMVVTCYLFLMTTYSNPGRIDKRHTRIEYWRKLYDSTLTSYANQPKAQRPPLCHTCHIARPLRSKHDRYTNCCILLFDHHCPFVGATIGLHNYRYFYSFCVAMTTYFIGYWIIFMTWWSRASNPAVTTVLYAMFLGVHGMFPAGMVLYHTQLISMNLTTNEHINMAKYDYLWQTMDGKRKFLNPWGRGLFLNFQSRFTPTEACYVIEDKDQEMRRLLEVSV